MSDMIVKPSFLSGEIDAIGSKSYAHRALIAASLLGTGTTEIYGITSSVDIEATVGCLTAIGVRITKKDGVYRVTPPRKVPAAAVFDCKESGSTLRFMLPIAAALGIDAQFVGSGRLAERPIGPLADTLRKAGVHVAGLSTRGRLRSGTHEIHAGISSQYISGLLFALSLVDGESKLLLKGDPVSREYIKITLDVLNSFGAEVYETDLGYALRGRKAVYSHIAKYTVEGDWSNAAFMLVAGALGGAVTVKGLKQKSLQGDRRIVDILKKAGADVNVSAGAVTVKRGSLKAFSVDAEQIPDTVPALAVLAAYSQGATRISGVDRLRIKESDRLEAILEMLYVAGINAEYADGKLVIEGGKPHGGKFNSFNDHRIAMSAAVLALYAEGESVICGGSCVDKSYPGFFDDIQKLINR